MQQKKVNKTKLARLNKSKQRKFKRIKSEMKEYTSLMTLQNLRKTVLGQLL